MNEIVQIDQLVTDQRKRVSTRGWAPGHTGNPLGQRSYGSRLRDRTEQLLETKTFEEIEAMVESSTNAITRRKLVAADRLVAKAVRDGIKGKPGDTMAFLEYIAPRPKDNDSAEIAQAVASGAVQGLMSALADKLSGVGILNDKP